MAPIKGMAGDCSHRRDSPRALFPATYNASQLSLRPCVQDPSGKTARKPRGDMRGRIIGLVMFAVLGSAFAMGRNVDLRADRRDTHGERVDRRQDRRDIHGDRRHIRHDRRQLSRAVRNGNYGKARHLRRDIRHDHRDLRADRRDLRHDRREIRHGRRDLRRDRRG